MEFSSNGRKKRRQEAWTCRPVALPIEMSAAYLISICNSNAVTRVADLIELGVTGV
jgi:hypothetical protein